MKRIPHYQFALYTLLVSGLVLFSLTFAPQNVQACSIIAFDISWPDREATDVPRNTRLLFYSILTEPLLASNIVLEDETNHRVSVTAVNDVPYGESITAFEPDELLNPDTEYTITITGRTDETYGFESTFSTGTQIDSATPELVELTLDTIVYAEEYVGETSCDYGEVHPAANYLSFTTSAEEAFFDDTTPNGLFVHVYLAAAGGEFDWSQPNIVTSRRLAQLSIASASVAETDIAVVVSDSAGNASCASIASFSTIDGTGAAEATLNEPLVASNECPPFATNNSGGEASASTGCQLQTRADSTSSDLLVVMALLGCAFIGVRRSASAHLP